MEDACAAVAVKGLDDDVAVLAAEGVDVVRAVRDEGRRHQLREVGREELLGRVPHAHRVVDDEGRGVDVLEEVGGRDVGEVEGRVLAHQDHVEPGEIDRLESSEGCMCAALAPDLERLGVRGEAPFAEAEIGGQVVVEGVPAALCLEGEDERAVGVDVDTVHMVHLDGDGESHGRGRLHGSGAPAILPASVGVPGKPEAEAPRVSGREERRAPEDS